jgi:hypothetical protein
MDINPCASIPDIALELGLFGLKCSVPPTPIQGCSVLHLILLALPSLADTVEGNLLNGVVVKTVTISSLPCIVTRFACLHLRTLNAGRVSSIQLVVLFCFDGLVRSKVL